MNSNIPFAIKVRRQPIIYLLSEGMLTLIEQITLAKCNEFYVHKYSQYHFCYFLKQLVFILRVYVAT